MTPEAGINRIHETASVIKDFAWRSVVHPDLIKLDSVGAVLGLAGLDDTAKAVGAVKKLIERRIVNDALVKRPAGRRLNRPTLDAGNAGHSSKCRGNCSG